jgi:hypothetical protein
MRTMCYTAASIHPDCTPRLMAYPLTRCMDLQHDTEANGRLSHSGRCSATGNATGTRCRPAIVTNMLTRIFAIPKNDL